MNVADLGLLWVAWVVAGGSPGPATLGIASISMGAGRRLGLSFALGILSGSAFWGVAAAFGMGALMLAHAWVFVALKYAGAAYLLYLAVKSLRASFVDKPLIAPDADAASHGKVYLKGCLIHLTNPKAILAWGAVYAIILPAGAAMTEIFGIFALLFSGSILVFLGYAFLFSTTGAVGIYRRARRWFDLAFAGLFGAASLKILTARV